MLQPVDGGPAVAQPATQVCYLSFPNNICILADALSFIDIVACPDKFTWGVRYASR